MKHDHSFNLGDLVKDRVTGFKGIVVAETEWLNGCVRLTVQPQGLTKEGKVYDSNCFDVEQLDLISPKRRPESPTKTGGPMPSVSRR